MRTNDYDFMSERALDACNTYGVESICLSALREAGRSRDRPGGAGRSVLSTRGKDAEKGETTPSRGVSGTGAPIR